MPGSTRSVGERYSPRWWTNVSRAWPGGRSRMHQRGERLRVSLRGARRSACVRSASFGAVRQEIVEESGWRSLGGASRRRARRRIASISGGNAVRLDGLRDRSSPRGGSGRGRGGVALEEHLDAEIGRAARRDWRKRTRRCAACRFRR